ncbi:protein phosphatase PPM8, putative [Plasmodium chabaudi chabaudi]|uniref:Protein phosphatase PPM8, putative n=1 Tax=Plasmodium chabaudi chabaudi TaxID=31271 RepID=A0A1D3RX44_PLACU|nr:protein phosphatase PPM8, putative [Plasmodium chabaudi chabaudi]
MGGLCHELRLGKKISSRKVLLCLAIFIISILVDNNNVLCQEKKPAQPARKQSLKTSRRASLRPKTAKTARKPILKKPENDEFVPIPYKDERGNDIVGISAMASASGNYIKGGNGDYVFENNYVDQNGAPLDKKEAQFHEFIKLQYMTHDQGGWFLEFAKDEDLDPTPFLRENSSHINVTQWEANDPVEDRAIVTLIDLNEIELKPMRTSYVSLRSTQEMFIEDVDTFMTDKMSKFIQFYKGKVKNGMAMPSHYTLADDADIFYKDDMYEPLSSSTSSSSNPGSSSGANGNATDVFKLKDNQFIFSSVMDGHGGPTMAELLKKWLPVYVKKNLMSKILNGKLKPRDIVSAIEDAHVELDEDILKVTLKFETNVHHYSPNGSCALSVLMDKHSYYVSNVGDSKSLLLRPNNFIVLNNIHNIAEPAEYEKMVKEHPNDKKLILARFTGALKLHPSVDRSEFPTTKKSGPLELYRTPEQNTLYLKGLLQCTRSFGDYFLKYKDRALKYTSDGKKNFQEPYTFPYITSHPEVFAVRRTKGDKYLVLATDGVTNDLSDFNIHSIFTKYNFSLKDSARLLVGAAIENHSAHSLYDKMRLTSQVDKHRRSYHDDSTIIVMKLF